MRKSSIEQNTIVRYTILMATPNLKTALWTLAMLGMLLPATTVAQNYMSPEEVLLNKEVYLPPHQGKDARNRQIEQQETSAERREREWAEEYARQHPAAPEPETPVEEVPAEEETESAIILPEGISQEDFDLLQAIKLIERRRTERILRFGTSEVVEGSLDDVASTHSGAPLAPTGAGLWLAAFAIVAAILWTMRRAKKSENDTWTSL